MITPISSLNSSSDTSSLNTASTMYGIQLMKLFPSKVCGTYLNSGGLYCTGAAGLNIPRQVSTISRNATPKLWNAGSNDPNERELITPVVKQTATKTNKMCTSSSWTP